MAEDRTYEGLINDPIFVETVKNFYKTRDGTEFKSSKEAIDAMLTDRAWRTTNSASIVKDGYSLLSGNMPPEQKKRLATIQTEREKIPAAGFRGGRPIAGAWADYIGAALADPMTYLTGGIGGAVGKAAASKAIGIATTAGLDAAVGGATDLGEQIIEKQTGARKELDPTRAAVSGAISGGLSGGVQAIGSSGLGGKIVNMLGDKAEQKLATKNAAKPDILDLFSEPTGLKGTDGKPIKSHAGANREQSSDELLEKMFQERQMAEGMHVDPILGRIKDMPKDANTDTYDQILNTYRQNYADLAGATRGVRTWEESTQAAEQLVKSKEFMTKLFKLKPGHIMNAEETGATALMVNDLRQNAVDMLKYISKTRDETGKIDTNMVDRFIKNAQMTKIAGERMRGLKAEQGRALNYNKKINDMMAKKGLSEEEIESFVSTKALDDMLAHVQGKSTDVTGTKHLLGQIGDMAGRTPSATEKFVNLLKTIDDDLDLMNFGMAVTKPNFWQKMQEYYVNSLLSNPKTWQINNLGNAMMGMSESAINYAAIPMGAARTSLKKSLGMKVDDFDRVRLNEANAEIQGTLNSFWDAIRLGRAAWADETYHTPIGRAEHGSHTYIEGELGRQIRQPGRILLGMDAFYATLAERGAINKLAIKEWNKHVSANPQVGHLNYADLNKADQLKYAKEFAENFLKDPPTAATKAANAEGQFRTFTTPLDGIMLDVLKMTNTNTAAGTALKMFVPFIRTPMNVIKHGSDYIPGAPIIRTALGRKLTGEEFDKVAVRQALGMGLMSWAAYEGFHGRMTGGGPSDFKEKEVYETRNQNRRFTYYGSDNIGFQYNRIDPWAITVGLGADLGYMMRRIAENHMPGMTPEKISKMSFEDVVKLGFDKGFLDSAGKIPTKEYVQEFIHSLSENIRSKSFFEGVDNMMKATSGEREFINAVGNVASGFVPKIIGEANRSIMDPVIRKPEGIVQNIMKDIPGLSTQLAPRIGPTEFSRQIMEGKPGGIVRKIEGGTYNPLDPAMDKGGIISKFSPIYTVTRHDDPLAREVAKYPEFLKELGTPEKTLPGTKIEMRQEQFDVYHNTRNYFFRQLAAPFVESDSYKSMALMGKDQHMAKVAAFKAFAKGSTALAKATLIQKFPGLRNEIVFDEIEAAMIRNPDRILQIQRQMGLPEPNQIKRRF